MTTWLIHGFNVSDGGRETVGHLAPYLSGNVKGYSYGWTGAFGLACANRRALLGLARQVRPGDSLVLHSNAGLIGWQLAQIMRNDLAAVVCINPALRRDAVWPDGLPVLCLHNSTDWVVQLGRLWGRLFPFDGVQSQGWGAAGRYGFTAPNKRLVNWDTAESYWSYPVKGHSGVFKEPAAEYWAGLVNQWLAFTSSPPKASSSTDRQRNSSRDDR